MKGSELKQRLHGGQPVYGTWSASTDPLVAGTVARAGFDWMSVDMEHSPRNAESLRYILWMIRDTPTVAMVRVKDNRPDELKQALDHGANGVVIPLIESVDDARRAVAGCKYPPAGIRGYGPFMPSFGGDNVAYQKTANDETLVFIQIEHFRAVEAIEEIAALEGIDGFIIGPNDLTLSMDIFGAWESEQFISTIQRIVSAGDAHGIPAGFPVDVLGGAEAGLAWVKKYAPQMRLLTIGGDLGFVSVGAEAALAQARGVGG